MIKVIETERIPIKLWLADIEEGALNQAKNLANFPFAFHHIAIMADAHQGYGMPIGGVMATREVVVPNAVGVDIGCGVRAVKTSLTEIRTETLKRIMGKIRKLIPLGFSHHKEKQDRKLMPDSSGLTPGAVVLQEFENARKQIGTLGGGNHFIEIQKGSDGFIWIMLHSGSRNIGYKVANYYNRLAVKLKERWRSRIPEKWQLDYLPLESQEGQNYLKEMNYCLKFASVNRKLMMDRITEIFSQEVKRVSFDPAIDAAHNYAAQETHFDKKVWVHRKGATRAEKGQIGIIPGSQGTNSFIVKGRGSPESFLSCSHGAGRKMGRNQARKTLDLEEEKKKLEEKGILHAIRGPKDLDEAAGAYKDINQVMKNQEDLVAALIELSPLAVIKG